MDRVRARIGVINVATVWRTNIQKTTHWYADDNDELKHKNASWAGLALQKKLTHQ